MSVYGLLLVRLTAESIPFKTRHLFKIYQKFLLHLETYPVRDIDCCPIIAYISCYFHGES